MARASSVTSDSWTMCHLLRGRAPAPGLIASRPQVEAKGVKAAQQAEFFYRRRLNLAHLIRHSQRPSCLDLHHLRAEVGEHRFQHQLTTAAVTTVGGIKAIDAHRRDDPVWPLRVEAVPAAGAWAI